VLLAEVDAFTEGWYKSGPKVYRSADDLGKFEDQDEWVGKRALWKQTYRRTLLLLSLLKSSSPIFA